MTKKKIKRRYYEGLYDVAAQINSARTPEDVLSSLVENVAGTLDAKGCSIMLLTPDRKRLLHTAAHGLSDWYIRKGPLMAEKSIAETLRGTPVAIFDASTDPRIQYPEQQAKEGVASILSIPMLLRDEVIGVMRVYTSESRYFSAEEIYFVSAVANLGAIALENAELYEFVHQDYVTIRQELLQWRAAFGDEWIGHGPGVVAHDWWKFI
ncbi:GAF domain-containing protein [Chloroflexota bacterium]